MSLIELAISTVNCSRNELNWTNVRNMLEVLFKNTGHHGCLQLQSRSKDVAKKMVNAIVAGLVTVSKALRVDTNIKLYRHFEMERF